MRNSRKASVIRHFLLTGLLAAVCLLGACGNDEEEVVVPGPGLTTTDVIPDVELSDNYFSDPSFIGQTVTVQGTVTRLIGPSSFVLDGMRYGKDSILVIATPPMDVEVGQSVDATGVVRQFGYDIYADEYELGETDLYNDYGAEQILVVGGSSASPDASARTVSPSPAG